MRPLLISLACAALAALATTPAHAWWNKDWSQRTRIVLDTAATGAGTKEAVSGAVIAVRLHSGNFDFVNAKEDGSDLRFVAGDDKTPLTYGIERFDSVSELALVWVAAPSVPPGTDKTVIYAYAGNLQAPAEARTPVFDQAVATVMQFSDAAGAGSGASTAGVQSVANTGARSAGPFTPETNGLLAGSARLGGTPVTWPASDRTNLKAGTPWTASLWIKPDDVDKGTVLQLGTLRIGLAGGRLSAEIGPARLAGGEIRPAAWTHVALGVAGGNAVLYLNGVPVAEPVAVATDVGGELRVGDGFRGLVDQIELATTRRSADWLRLAVAAQAPDGKLIATTRETGDEAAPGGHPNYLGVLVGNLTTDAWVVIGILGVMFAVACWVMVTKALFVRRADLDNARFLHRFRGATVDMLHLERGAAHPHSSLFRLYQAGVRELKKRNVGVDEQLMSKPLSGASLNAVKASIDADLVRESNRLNAQMVLLTIAISGGPFLGLLGTVVGVMITFAAIAAAGDVNVNAIAPGIAAALLATVAGLAVAIPALFGYNYLASRIKNISSEMQIFVDEFVTRVAETHGAR